MSAEARDLFERARAAAAGGRFDEALRAADALCGLAPVDVQAARLRAVLLTQGERAGAVEAWQRVLALYAFHGDPWAVSGWIAAQRARYAASAVPDRWAS